jgi:predicted DNA-binding protein with PD1-like motif
MITLQHVNPGGTRVYMGTLTNGVALHAALAELAHTLAIEAATVDLLGGLTAATLTAYDFTRHVRAAPRELTGALEIVSGHGTISRLDDAPHVHLHAVLAPADAAPLVGGHLAAATVFAVEFTLTCYDGAPVVRRLHPDTGLQLWSLPPWQPD